MPSTVIQRSRINVVLQVMAVLLFPLGLLLSLTTQATIRADERADVATEADRTLAELVQLVSLQSALADEALLSYLLQWDVDSPSPEAASAILDVSGAADLDSARDRTSELFEAIAPENRPFTEADLIRVRQVVDINREVGVPSRQMTQLEGPLADLISSKLDDARAGASVLNDGQLGEALFLLEARVDAYLSSTELIGNLTAFWFALPVEEAVARASVAQAQTKLDEALDLVGEDSGVVTGQVVLAAPGFDRQVDDALIGSVSPLQSSILVDELVADMAEGLDRNDSLADTSLEASATAKQLVEERRSATRRSAMANLAVAAFATVVSLATATWCGWSIVSSMSRRDELEDELVHQASVDHLTGLANRRSAIERIQELVEAEDGSDGFPAVLFVDLDRFKSVNDSLGHHVGDLLLVEVAARLVAASRNTDLAARLGGDEFLLIVNRCFDIDEVTLVAERIVADLSAPYRIGEHDVHVSASAGIALADRKQSVGTLLHQADVAAYAAKDSGPNGRVVAYAGQLQAEVEAAETIEGELTTSLDSAEGLEVQYQPIVNVNGDMVGLEALVRWDRFGQGLVSAVEFIAVAERSDLVTKIDRWAVARALRDLRQLHEETGNHNYTMSVNISGRHVVERSFADRMMAAIEEAGVSPSTLIVEVTETVLVHDMTTAIRNLSALRAIGCRVSIDDFGTGFTSINQLLSFPADELKIDRSLVVDRGKPGNQLASLVVRMADTLGLTTVAEGIETEEKAESMRAIGCTHLQGYHFARPMDMEGVLAWLAAEHRQRRMLRAGAGGR